MKKRLYLAMAVTLVLAALSAVTVANQGEEPPGGHGPSASARSAKITAVNKSGQAVVFYSWHPFYGFWRTPLPPNGQDTDPYHYIGWRILGVWTTNGESCPGWAASHKFDDGSNVTVTINPKTLTIK